MIIFKEKCQHSKLAVEIWVGRLGERGDSMFYYQNDALLTTLYPFKNLFP